MSESRDPLGVLEALLAEEAEARTEAARNPKNDYMPETYGFLEAHFARHGGLDEQVMARVADGFAHARRGRRHMVFQPNPDTPDGISGPLLVIGTGFIADGRMRVQMLWADQDGQVRTGQDFLPHGAPESLPDNETTLRCLAARHSTGPLNTGRMALSGHSSAAARFALGYADSIWEETRGAAGADVELEPRDRDTLESGRRQFLKLQADFERKRLSGSLARFTRHLNPEAMRVLHQTGVFGVRRYNWLVGEGRPERRHNRLQAAQAYPLFFAEMSKASATNLHRTIDEGAPLAPALAKALGNADEATLKRLQGVHWQRAGRYTSHHPADALKNLGMIPGNWTPKGRKDWAAFHVAMEACRSHGDNLRRNPEQLVKATRGDWQTAARDLVRLDTAGARDMLNDINDKIVLPAIAHRLAAAGVENWDQAHGPASRIQNGLDREALSAAVFGDKSLKKVHGAIRRWHHSLPRIEAAGVDEKSAAIAWEPLSAPHTTGKGWRVTPLVTASELAEEGRAMRHCVSGYARACIEGGRHILSIRDPEGGRVSTVELAEEDPATFSPRDRKRAITHVQAGDRLLVAYQNYGVENDEGPGPVDRPQQRAAVLKDYLKTIAASPPDYARLDAGRARAAQALEEIGGLRSVVGYDPERRDVHQAVFDIQRESMIGPGRAAQTPEAFLELAGLTETIDRNVAEYVEHQRRKQAEQAIRTRNAGFVEAARAGTAPDPDARPDDAMSFQTYYSLPEDIRPKRVNRVLPGEGALRDFEIARHPDGRPVDGDKAAGAQLVQHLTEKLTTETTPFLQTSLLFRSDTPVVALSDGEAKAYRSVCNALARAHRERAQGHRITVAQALQDPGVARYAEEVAAAGRDRGQEVGAA